MNRGSADADVIALVARAELRRRWRTYLVLGVLLGATAGLATAGFAGAARGHAVVSRWDRVADEWDFAFVPNDPSFDAAQHRAIAALPGVQRAEPFSIAFVEVLVDGESQPDLWPGLAPTPEAGLPVAPYGAPIVEGRQWDPTDPGEVVIDENARRSYGLQLGDRIELRPIEQADAIPLTVVGVVHSTERMAGGSWTPSAAFMGAHPEIQSITNLAVWLEPGVDPAAFAAQAAEVTGRDELPYLDLMRSTRELHETTAFESSAVRMWALAVTIAGLTLIGQAVIRTLVAASGELAVLDALGMSRTARRGAIAAPAIATLVAALAVCVPVAAVASARFPIGLARGFDLDVGMHLDARWTALGLAGLATSWAVLAWYGSVLGTRQLSRTDARATRLSALSLRAPVSVPLRIGLRMAVDPGRGHRAVPVRSALVGVAVGVMGVVGAFTFRAGLDELLAHPSRAGTNADLTIGAQLPRSLDAAERQLIGQDPDVEAAASATWHRSLLLDGVNVSTWTFEPIVGAIEPTVLEGRLPVAPDEIALAPVSLDVLDVSVGDTVSADAAGRPLRVVGEVLLPEESHQGYASGGFMTPEGYASANGGSGVEDVSSGGFAGGFVELRPGADGSHLTGALQASGVDVAPAAVPDAFSRLHEARFLSLGFSAFLVVLAVAALAHALVLTVRRRRTDLAVLGALGLSGRARAGVVVGQASAITLAALVLGLPLGVYVGRTVWRIVIDTYSFLYVAPAAALLAAVVVPGALVLANATASVPGRMARRIGIAGALRSE